MNLDPPLLEDLNHSVHLFGRLVVKMGGGLLQRLSRVRLHDLDALLWRVVVDVPGEAVGDLEIRDAAHNFLQRAPLVMNHYRTFGHSCVLLTNAGEVLLERAVVTATPADACINVQWSVFWLLTIFCGENPLAAAREVCRMPHRTNQTWLSRTSG